MLRSISRCLCVLALAGCDTPDPPMDTGRDARALDAGMECAPIDNAGVDVATGAFWAGQRFNPQSEWLAVIRYEGLSPVGISVLDFCGESIAEVDTTDIAGTYLAWADERTIYFGGGAGIMRVSIGGGGGAPTMLLADADSFDVSPDDGTIVFSRDGDLHLYDVDTMAETDLSVTGTFPRYSPSGTKIAFLDAGLLKVLTLAGSSVEDGPMIGTQVFQPFDWTANDFSLGIKSTPGIDAVEFDPELGVITRTVANVGDVIDIDIAPDGRFMTFRRNGMRGFTVYGVPERPDMPVFDSGLPEDAGR